MTVAPLSDVDLRAAASVFKALGHPERIRIAALLADGSSTTQHALLEELPWAQSTVARHVGLLRERGILAATRCGNEVHLRLTNDLVPRMLALLQALGAPAASSRVAAPFGYAETVS